MDQTEIRRRRRVHLPVINDGEWSLRREIAEVVTPLAARVAAAPRPTRFRLPVGWLAEDVHELAGTVTGWVAEVAARAKTEHLADDEGKRRFAMTTLVDLAPRPAAVELTDAMLADASWAAALIEMVAPVDAGLSDLLARAFPPGAPSLRGQPSRSDRLDALLRETVDRATLELSRRLDRADREQSVPAALAKAEQAKAELAALGIEV